MKTIKKIKWWLISLIALVALLIVLFFPLPYYVEMPGGAYDIRSVVKVNGKEDKDKGSYQFVAVSLSRASLAQLLYAWLTPLLKSVQLRIPQAVIAMQTISALINSTWKPHKMLRSIRH